MTSVPIVPVVLMSGRGTAYSFFYHTRVLFSILLVFSSLNPGFPLLVGVYTGIYHKDYGGKGRESQKSHVPVCLIFFLLSQDLFSPPIIPLLDGDLIGYTIPENLSSFPLSVSRSIVLVICLVEFST
jgi:hypothetical protein